MVVEDEAERTSGNWPTSARWSAAVNPSAACSRSRRPRTTRDNGRFYAAYTGTAAAGGAEGDVHVDSFQTPPRRARPAVRDPILSVGHAAFANHNGGQLQFGPDGLSLHRDRRRRGRRGTPTATPRDTGDPARQDPAHRPRVRRGGPPYTIPPDNPFVGATAGRDEIWSYGLRNPWRFSFDRLTGDTADRRRRPGHARGGRLRAGRRSRRRRRGRRQLRLELPRGLRSPTRRRTSPATAVATAAFADPVFDYPHNDPEDGERPPAARSPAATSSGTRASPTSTAATSTPTSASARSAPCLPPAAARHRERRPLRGPRRSPSPTSFGEDSCGTALRRLEGGTVYRLEGAGAEPLSRRGNRRSSLQRDLTDRPPGRESAPKSRLAGVAVASATRSRRSPATGRCRSGVQSNPAVAGS